MAKIKARHVVVGFDDSDMARMTWHRIGETPMLPHLDITLIPATSTRTAAHGAMHARASGQPRKTGKC